MTSIHDKTALTFQNHFVYVATYLLYDTSSWKLHKLKLPYGYTINVDKLITRNFGLYTTQLTKMDGNT